MKQLTKKQAIAFYESGQWKDLDDEEIIKLQLFQRKLCIPFSIFHQACGRVFDRPIWSHEFADCQKLQEEWLGLRPDPTWEEIIAPIRDKVVFYD